jgi:hypothetical protein
MIVFDNQGIGCGIAARLEYGDHIFGIAAFPLVMPEVSAECFRQLNIIRLAASGRTVSDI